MFHNITFSDEDLNGINPVNFGYEDCEKSHGFGPAIRTTWLIHFVVSGTGIFRIKGKEYKLSAGEMFVIPPYEETYYEADFKNPWEYIWIAFTADGGLPVKLDDTVYCPEALKIFSDMKRSETINKSKSIFLCAKLWELFSLLTETEEAEPDYVTSALNFIRSEYMNGITVGEIAERLNLDRSYFSTLFKKKVGISPEKYLLNYRMSLAASLLKMRRMSVSVVSYSVGYTNIYNFSKMFKKRFGVSPKEYAAIQRA